MPKLTLNVDRAVIAKARRLAAERGVSVSTLSSQLVEGLGHDAPISRRTWGLAKVSDSKSDRELVEEAIIEKHIR